MAERVDVLNTDNAVCLRRLLHIANLTPSQAHFLAREVTAAAQSHPVDLDSVFIDQYGDAVVTQGGDRKGLAAVLAALAAVAEHDVRYGTTLRTAAGAAARGAGPAAILSIVDQVPQAPERPLAEVSALVRTAIGHETRPAAQPSPAPPAPPDGARRPKLRVVLRPFWRALAAVVVLAAAVLFEFVFLHDHLASDLNLLQGGQKPATTSAPAARAPQPVAAAAPASAGAISGAEVRALGPCKPGSTCDVRVLVRLAGAPQPTTVRWEFQFTDRCTGARSTSPGGTLAAGAGDSDLSVVDQVPLPAARALGLQVVTTSPAHVAGAPLLLGDTSC
ncbi:MAG TPA: hypothetical protein VJ870_09770 [Amycolatopsis sp.]|nr:hypothetical protein [Amycolatopsis sp.]